MTTDAIEQQKADLMATYQQTIERLVKERDALALAVRIFVANDEAMERILWGDKSDNEMIKITISLGKYRLARKALSVTRPKCSPEDKQS